MNNHNCYIGEWINVEDKELITFEDLSTKIQEYNETYEYALNSFGQSFVDGFMKKKNIEDYFDNRKSTNINKFNYCPVCGKEIQWKLMKELTKQKNTNRK